MRRKTKDEVISEFISTHGNTYDYSLVDYKNNRTKVKIICKEHGEFEQSPDKHRSGQGCPICRYIKSGNSQKITQEQCIDDFINAHGNTYDYSLVDYKGDRVKVRIVCKIHGEFTQTPNNHKKGQGCPSCKVDKMMGDTDWFISRAKSVHGDTYDYSLVDYTTSKQFVKIICKDHGVFEQRPNNHLNGQCCPVCKYDYLRNDIKSFISKSKEIHGDRYDYSLVDYINIRTKVKIVCKNHGEFEQRPDAHMIGQGCPVCAKSISNQELEFLDFIKSIYDGEIITNTRGVITPYELDIFLPDIDIAFEYNGDYWHEEGLRKPEGYHQMKTDMCNDKGVKLYHIWESEWMVDDRTIIKENVRRIVV